MQRRIVDDQDGWAIEEVVDRTPSRAYFYREQLAIRVPLDSKIARRLGGLILIEKDLRTLKSWVAALRRQLEEFGADADSTTTGLMPTDEPEKLGQITIARALYVAIVTTYGKLFTSAEGRRTSLQKKDVVPEKHGKIHEHLMHTRHTFAAHSGAHGPEGCEVILAVDYSRRNRTSPRIFTELHQPTTIGLPELRDVDALIDSLHMQVREDIEKSTRATYDEVGRTFDENRMYFLRKDAPGTYLRRA